MKDKVMGKQKDYLEGIFEDLGPFKVNFGSLWSVVFVKH